MAANFNILPFITPYLHHQQQHMMGIADHAEVSLFSHVKTRRINVVMF